MPEFQLKTAVAFIVFNRPDTTERVFAEIARARPPLLLVVGDGPRSDRSGEAQRVAAVRGIIARVDWDCEVRTNYSEGNLGCRNRVSSGIDWVFDQVEEAIILEDDCLPEPTFFRFCEEMLIRYKNDKRVGMISGDNFQFGRSHGPESYYFSKYVHVWGWASWRDRWKNSYDVSLTDWPRIRDCARFVDMVGSPVEAIYWKNIFQRVYENKIDTWDYQWLFANWLMGCSSIVPAVNLISNIGFNKDATHTTGDSDLANLLTKPMQFPIKHPVDVLRNGVADQAVEKIFFQTSLKRRIVIRFLKWFHL